MGGALRVAGPKRVISIAWRIIPDFLASMLECRRRTGSLMGRLPWGKLYRLELAGREEEVIAVVHWEKLRHFVCWIDGYHRRLHIPFWMNDVWLVRIVSEGGLSEGELYASGFRKRGTEWVLVVPPRPWRVQP